MKAKRNTTAHTTPTALAQLRKAMDSDLGMGGASWYDWQPDRYLSAAYRDTAIMDRAVAQGARKELERAERARAWILAHS